MQSPRAPVRRNLAHGNKLSNRPSNLKKKEMVSLGTNANLEKPNPESGRKAVLGDCLSGSGLSKQCGSRDRHLHDRKRIFVHPAFAKPVGKKRMPVIQWVARCWVQPIGKP
jgi:hypothetical protein